jgi:hypothetical protein
MGVPVVTLPAIAIGAAALDRAEPRSVELVTAIDEYVETAVRWHGLAAARRASPGKMGAPGRTVPFAHSKRRTEPPRGPIPEACALSDAAARRE